MSALAVYKKTPGDVLDYDVDFARWLPDGDIIVDATAVVAGEDDEDPEINPLIVDPPVPADPIVIDSVEFSDTVVKVWASHGDDREEKEITVTATTQGGRVKTTCFRLRIEEC